MHAWHEPFDRIIALAWEKNVLITTPQMGQPFYVQYPCRGKAWWLGMEGVREVPLEENRGFQYARRNG
jgi:hypothetical protein